MKPAFCVYGTMNSGRIIVDQVFYLEYGADAFQQFFPLHAKAEEKKGREG